MKHRFEIENEGHHLSQEEMESIWEAYISKDQVEQDSVFLS